MSKVDMELKKAFSELQLKAIETLQKVKLSDVQIETLRQNKKRAGFTETQIGEMDSSCRMYELVGRAFILTPKDQIITNLKQVQKTADEKIKTLDNNKAYLERSMKDAENNIREMVQQRK